MLTSKWLLVSNCPIHFYCAVLSRVWLFPTPRSEVCQAPLSMLILWSGLTFPPPGDLPNPEIKPSSPTLQVDSLPSEPPGKPIHSYGQLNSSAILLFTAWSCSLKEHFSQERKQRSLYYSIQSFIYFLRSKEGITNLSLLFFTMLFSFQHFPLGIIALFYKKFDHTLMYSDHSAFSLFKL